MALAKICGISTRPALEAALAGGAAFVGFMVFPASPRRVSIAGAADLAALARGRAKVVAVTVDPNDALVEALLTGLAPDFIQLHGREPPERAREIAARGVGVIKAIAADRAADRCG